MDGKFNENCIRTRNFLVKPGKRREIVTFQAGMVGVRRVFKG